MKRARTLRIAVLAVGILLVGVVGRVLLFPNAKPIAEEKLVAVERGDVARSVVARGKIEPLSQIDLKSKANGIIKALFVDVGDKVKPGQVFSRIHVDDLTAALAASITRPRAGGIYNVCDDEPSPPQDVIAEAARLLGVEPPPEIAFDAATMPVACCISAGSKSCWWSMMPIAASA